MAARLNTASATARVHEAPPAETETVGSGPQS